MVYKPLSVTASLGFSLLSYEAPLRHVKRLTSNKTCMLFQLTWLYYLSAYVLASITEPKKVEEKLFPFYRLTSTFHLICIVTRNLRQWISLLGEKKSVVTIIKIIQLLNFLFVCLFEPCIT